MLEKRNNIFGTDGIRGRYGDFPLDKDSISKIGNIIGELFNRKKIIIGRDTRESSDTIFDILTNTINDKVKIINIGIASTPMVSYLTKTEKASLGISITASHNPYHDNGLKFFNSDGEKIEDHLKNIISNEFLKKNKINFYSENKIINEKHLINKYIDFVIKGMKLNNTNKKILIDAANGATFEIVEKIFSKLNIKYKIINNNPDGKNINKNCGSTHIEKLKDYMLESDFELAVSFDGDGDRIIFMDSELNILDGDFSLLLISDFLFKTGEYNKIVIGTIMSNLGIEEELNRRGIKFYRSKVGDENVYKLMKEKKAVIGGENSGHTILLNKHNTGDGILTSIYFLKALDYFSIKPNTLYKSIKLYPQKTKSLYVKSMPELDEIKGLNKEIKRFEQEYKNNARLIIRYSGTEPKIRIMVEAENYSIIEKEINLFKNIILNKIGVKT